MLHNIDVLSSEENKISPTKNKLCWLIATAIVVILGVSSTIFYFNQANEFTFEMNKGKTVNTETQNGQVLSVDTGYFNLPEDYNVTLNVAGNIDSGSMKVTIVEVATGKKVYQLSGEELSDTQQIFLSKSSYKIQVEATDYQENFVSLNYQVKLEG